MRLARMSILEVDFRNRQKCLYHFFSPRFFCVRNHAGVVQAETD